MPLFTSWASIAENLAFEIDQAAYEGRRVPERLRREVAALEKSGDLFEDPRARALFAALRELPPDPDFPYEQPGELEAIRARRPDGPRRLPMALGEAELLDRLAGAWTGRCCGCALGKPVEMFSLIHRGRLRIRDHLQRRDQWPLDFYFSAAPRDDDEHPIGPRDPATREHLDGMPPDDDIHYTLMGLHVLETHGPDFAWHDVADAWNASLPYAAICTAESQAIMNYNLRNVRGGDNPFPQPDWTARHNNPYREWIGAQIRADGWAWCAAGNPELAAELAWRDAHWTHTANGIYGEMFMAAMMAAAFVVEDPAELVRIGLSEIPETCRLAEAVQEALSWTRSCPDFEAFMERLEAGYGALHPVHTVNNAMVCVAALVYGGMDPAKTICTAVMCGLDTDCNGATVGSITGAIAGESRYPDRWKAPLGGTIRPQMIGFQDVRIDDLARRTLAVHRQLAQG